MKKRLPRSLWVIILSVAGILCIISFFGTNNLLSIPSAANSLYGPPSPTLSTMDIYNLSYKLINAEKNLLVPTDPNGGLIEFTILPDEPVNTILANLETQSLIPDSQALSNYLIYKGYDTQIQAGTFALTTAMTPVEIALTILNASPSNTTLVILPGWRLEEIANTLPSSGLTISPQEFITAAQQRPTGISFISEIPFGSPIEGFFFPDTYQVIRNLTPNELINILLANFDRQVTPDIKTGFTQQGLTLYQGVTIASIVEREAVITEEKPVIASVLLNRLNNNIRLETDPTVQYALGYNQTQSTWWTNPLSFNDLQFDSLYNTYLYAGLPPGPISNPSLAALRAVAFPADTDYLYFRAACDGSGAHNFAYTYEEHVANGCH